MSAEERRGLVGGFALAAAVLAWVPLAVLAVVGALPAGRSDSGEGLFRGPAWPFLIVVFTDPLTSLLGVVALALGFAAYRRGDRRRGRRTMWIAAAALVTLVIANVVLSAVSDSLN